MNIGLALDDDDGVIGRVSLDESMIECGYDVKLQCLRIGVEKKDFERKECKNAENRQPGLGTWSWDLVKGLGPSEAFSIWPRSLVAGQNTP
nr:hypothetical protein [Tanacetum cinerariifolium]